MYIFAAGSKDPLFPASLPPNNPDIPRFQPLPLYPLSPAHTFPLPVPVRLPGPLLSPLSQPPSLHLAWGAPKRAVADLLGVWVHRSELLLIC